jgi:hypothetical protein
LSNEDLTKVGHLPNKQQHRVVKQLRTIHCVDHARFRESCHNCLLMAVEELAERVAELEKLQKMDPYKNSRHPQRRK